MNLPAHIPEPKYGMKWEVVPISEQCELLPNDWVDWSGGVEVGPSQPGGESFRRGVAVGQGKVYRQVNDGTVDTLEKLLDDMIHTKGCEKLASRLYDLLHSSKIQVEITKLS